MIANEVELDMQRRQTDAFIRADSFSVALNRQSKIPNGSGGFQLGPVVTLDRQTFHFVPQNRQLEERQTTDGKFVRPDSVLIGYYDADVQRDDWFLDEHGHRYDVVYVAEKRDYETRADLVYRG